MYDVCNNVRYKSGKINGLKHIVLKEIQLKSSLQ